MNAQNRRAASRRAKRFWSPLPPLTLSLIGICLLAAGGRADRYVLAPSASTLNPLGFKFDFLTAPSRGGENYSWVQYSSPVGIELEYNRFDRFGDGRIRNSFNLQYPILSDLGEFPAISVGVRDLFGTGTERGSFYLMVGKDLPLSDRLRRWIKEFNVSGGGGTNFLSGPVLGTRLKLRSGATLTAEYFRYRWNGSLGVPLIRHLQGNVSSLNGQMFYGLTYTFAP